MLSGFVTAAGNSTLLFQQTVSLVHTSAIQVPHGCNASVNHCIVIVIGRLNWTLWCLVISSLYSPHSSPVMIWQRRSKPTATCYLSVTVSNRLTLKSMNESPPGPRAIPKAHSPETDLTPFVDWSHRDDWQLRYTIWRKNLVWRCTFLYQLKGEVAVELKFGNIQRVPNMYPKIHICLIGMPSQEFTFHYSKPFDLCMQEFSWCKLFSHCVLLMCDWTCKWKVPKK